MPTFRSDSSSSTTMTVSLTEILRVGTSVRIRVNWSVKLGSATNLGSSSSNNRTLYIYRSTGVLLGSAVIKSSFAWSAGNTYSGSFVFDVDVGTMDAGSWQVYIQTSESGTQSCIWTDRDYCTNFDFAWLLYWTAATAPKNPRILPTTYETGVTLAWDGATAGANNAVSGYYVYYRQGGGAEQSINVGNVTSWPLNTSGWARGTSLDFRVAAVTHRGDNPASSFSAAVIKNRVPNQPTSPSVPKTSYIPGELIRVSFANTGDPDGNLAGFEAATDASETIVGTIGSALATYVDVDTTDWEQSIQRRFRVRGYDALGVRGPWSTYTAQVTLNTAPLPPEISYPAAGSTVYNQRPHILLKAAVTNDGPKHILCINDGSEKTTAAGTGFSCGANDDLASERQVGYIPPANLSGGTVSLSARMFDSFLYSTSVTRSFTVAAFAPADPVLTTPGMRIKAAMITELQTAIGNLRAAYGMTAVSWTPCVVSTTLISAATALIEQLQDALQAVINRINGWDAANATGDITVAWISPAAEGGGVDPVKLRQAIEQLRSTIILI